MTPDLGTIARRRHAATVALRAIVTIWVAYALWLTLEYLVSQLDAFLNAGFLAWVFQLAIPLLARLVLAAIVLLLEKRLVRWIVPIGSRDNACPRCGYALKDLKSPVCPECGLDLRSAG
jgi:hypothetical protein